MSGACCRVWILLLMGDDMVLFYDYVLFKSNIASVKIREDLCACVCVVFFAGE